MRLQHGAPNANSFDCQDSAKYLLARLQQRTFALTNCALVCGKSTNPPANTGQSLVRLGRKGAAPGTSLT
jgi:hypothetical protein